MLTIIGFDDGVGVETPPQCLPGGAFVVNVTAWLPCVPGCSYSLDSLDSLDSVTADR